MACWELADSMLDYETSSSDRRRMTRTATASLRRFVVWACVISSSTLIAATGPKSAVNTGGGELAIKGYDVVAYLTGAAVQGKPQFTYRWNGAVWQFSTAKNRDRFAKAPGRYAPQFGGYCAWAISRGYTADVDPEVFQIVGGKLYLIYSKSVELRWNQDVSGNIAKAQANWPAVLNK
jgi:hypothetical protein